MTNRELFRRIMHYEEFDRLPVWHWDVWPETLAEWIAQGHVPPGADLFELLHADRIWSLAPVNMGLLPQFEEEILEETADYRIIRQNNGVVAQHSKRGSSIPRSISFTMKDRSGWEEYRKRLQPDPKRLAPDFDKECARVEQSGRPVVMDARATIGWARDWMGVENLGYACHDDRALLAELCDTVAELICWGIDQVGNKLQIDLAISSEDICFRSGPLVSPQVFKECCVPAYRKIRERLEAHGCDLYMVDCDGKLDDLVPLWLEGGVNILYPIEIGTWKADPLAFRKRYGREFRCIGAIDKLELPKGREAIDAEIERRLPLMKLGGYIPIPDHLIVPGTPLEDYRYYLERIRTLRF